MTDTRILSDRFKDTWTVNSGREAARIRREVKAEQEEALARYDEDPSEANKAAFAKLADTETVIGARLAKQNRRAA